MLWNVPEAGEPRSGEAPPRMLAVAGALQRRQRTVLTMVPLAGVRPNPDQPRKHFAEDKLAELASSIRTRGLLQPIVVRRTPEGFELLAGERRFRAAQIAGLERLPALLREGDDPLEIALIENLQREDLTPLEEAEALAALIERHGYSHQEVADILGRSRPYVSNMLALTRLPETVKDELQQVDVTMPRELLMSVAREQDPGSALQLWNQLKEKVPSVRHFREVRHQTSPNPISPGAVAVTTAAARFLRAMGQVDPRSLSAEERIRLARSLRRTQGALRRYLADLSTVET